MHASLLTHASLLIASSGLVTAQGLYTKSSPVLQVDAKNYDRLIAKSNYTSIVEFYAPWCGHCKNLKPAYEKAATSLDGVAKVAAINCDDDSNKPFCGSMGVQGFPTLKIVKPSKKAGGKSIVEDYVGQRTAKAISDAVADKIPNHVQRVKDANLDKFLETSPETPKALFFSEKGLVPAMVKALAIDFKGGIDFGFIQSQDRKAVERFQIKSFPSVLLLRTENEAPISYGGDVKKAPLVEFLSQVIPPHPESAPRAPKRSDSSRQFTKDSGNAKKKPKGASETLAPSEDPKPSPDPNVANDPPPVQLPVNTAPAVVVLDTDDGLRKACLHSQSSTCVLVVASAGDSESSGPSDAVVRTLGDITEKHRQRGAKVFPVYSLPDSNPGIGGLLQGLRLKDPETQIIAINAKRLWWTRFDGQEMSSTALGNWIDGIRLGDFKKQKLPDDLIKDASDSAEDDALPKIEVVEEIIEDGSHVKSGSVPEKEL